MCSQDVTSRVKYFRRDDEMRVTLVAEYGFSSCAEEPWLSRAPLRATSFEYGSAKPIAAGVTLPLNIVIKTYKTSVFGAQLAAAAGGGTSPDAFVTSETLDHDRAAKSGDPLDYSCGASTLPVGAAPCRRIVEGYSWDANGVPTLHRIATFYSYDSRGRVVRVIGPRYVLGQAPLDNVDPVEERSYWPDGDADAARRGRLMEIRRWPSGWPAAASALTTSFDVYDAFGPTQVTDAAGHTTVFTRVGGAGRVTRVDTPDGRHVTTRYYDGPEPRLLLLASGATRRFTYDARGRLHTIEPLSGDPENPAIMVTSGWLETRAHDAAGNTTLVTRADALGIRWEQRFSHYASGAIKDVFHPEAGKRYATWKRADDGLPSEFWDEDLNVTSLVRDGLRRIEQTWFAVGNEQRDSWTASSGHLSYAYEPGQDVLKRVHSSSLSRNLVEYVHDDFGRLLWVTAPSTMVGGAFTYAYDARGNVVQRSGGGTLVTYRYDGLDSYATHRVARPGR